MAWRPNHKCDLYRPTKSSGAITYDNWGRPTYPAASQPSAERVDCSVITLDLKLDRSSVRADSSATRGRAEQIGGDAIMLFPTSVAIEELDIVKVENRWLEVISVFQRRNVFGDHDHDEVVLRKSEPID